MEQTHAKRPRGRARHTNERRGGFPLRDVVFRSPELVRRPAAGTRKRPNSRLITQVFTLLVPARNKNDSPFRSCEPLKKRGNEQKMSGKKRFCREGNIQPNDDIAGDAARCGSRVVMRDITVIRSRFHARAYKGSAVQ